jgi:hypothetical protein
MDQYAREVSDFRFLPLKDNSVNSNDKDSKSSRRLRVTIGINGWLTSPDEVTTPWRCLASDTEVFALRFELDSLLELGRSLENMVSSYAWKMVKMEILKRTVLASLYAALWPAYLLKTASNIDNPFNRARNRSEKAGKILADALINRVQGERPVTLVGYSLGARVVYACLRELARRRAFGLLDTVVLIGAPVPSDRKHWLVMRSVVAGRLFNVYSENDYILAFMYRAASVQFGVAGLQAIQDIDGVENLDLSEEVKGHLRYPDLIAQILTRCGLPDIEGGQGPIEKEKEDAVLADDTSATGSLIELDDLPPEEDPRLPLRPQQSGLSSQQTQKPPPSGPAKSQTRAIATKTQSEALTENLDPLRSLSLEDSSVKPLARPARQPRELNEPSASQPQITTVSTIQRPGPSVISGAPEVQANAETRSKSMPAMVSSFDSHTQQHTDDDDDDSDEGYTGGIKMVDND